MKPEVIATATALSTAISKSMAKEGGVGSTDEELRARCVEIAFQIAPTKDLKSIIDTASELATFVFSGYTVADLDQFSETQKEKLLPLPEEWDEYCKKHG